ncbi:hypothetical protein EVJ58_g9809 [Rhodofomes roseus]|uniref:Reverse transcriptase zinc-binding domain-containing protein n=1 Tax=Rhodofomes roseus TaxID=34475 RepID=A0A4Y9XTQ4_9APHY|nr:hypothetical protein EVJ58_g9809 [Rhodofomes roseus]
MALYAVQATHLDTPLHFICADPTLINTLFRCVPQWEDRGWIGVHHAEYPRTLVNALRQRCAVTTFQIAASPEEWHTLDAARADATNVPPRDYTIADSPDLDMNPMFLLTGAKLTSLTQSTAYRGISGSSSTPERRRTTALLSRIKTYLENTEGLPVPSSEIWQSLRHRDLRLPVSDFLWKCIHNAHRSGDFWTNIPGYEDRAVCSVCHETESLQHILTSCNATGQRTVWNLVAKVWKKRGYKWRKPSFEGILSIGQKSWKTAKGKRSEGASRLWRILVSEAAYMIWKLRCTRVVGHADEEWQHSKRGVKALTLAALNARLTMDRELLKKKYCGHSLTKKLVLTTWFGTLRDPSAIPDDWTDVRRFLVGMVSEPRIEIDPG